MSKDKKVDRIFYGIIVGIPAIGFIAGVLAGGIIL